MISKKLKKTLIIALSALVLVAACLGFYLYRAIYSPNIFLKDSGRKTYLYIPSGASIDTVYARLYAIAKLENKSSFEWVASLKHYSKKIRAGRYLIEDGMSNNYLINILRSGSQTPVPLTINFYRKKEDLALYVSQKLETKRDDILKILNDKTFLAKYNFNSATAIALFLPNTYQFKWNTSAEEFVDRMATEYEHFWTDDRRSKATALGLQPTQVVTLASIVHSETRRDDEKPTIAGVYLNRYRIGMPLQADPTVIYAVGDYSIRRVTGQYTSYDSPYNTYRYTGLPPGPICTPSAASIDAVLNAETHNYLYFCAKEDFSGYHSYAETYSKHLENARRFQKALDARNIK